MLTIAKFGGTSLKDAAAFETVKTLILTDPSRRGCVVSAPGRRWDGDEKVTDLLIVCHERWTAGRDWRTPFRAAAARFLEIAENLGVCKTMEEELQKLETQVAEGVSRDFLLSRGEYFSARIMAQLLNWEFLDSAAWLRFRADGTVDSAKTYGLLRRQVTRPFVTPGFYGLAPSGEICTFSRGGSDVTGALAAAALEADLYENWTDVPGILQADPRLLPNAKTVTHLTYGELAELAEVGTQVLHEGAVRPVRQAGIPLQIRSTFLPQHEGTLVLPRLRKDVKRTTLLCLAGKPAQALISLETERQGTLEKLLREKGVSPTVLTHALHRQTAAVPSSCVETLLEDLGTLSGELSLQDGVALVAVILAKEEPFGPAVADLLSALKEKKISVHAILRPFGGHTLLLAVGEEDFLPALHALHGCAR